MPPALLVLLKSFVTEAMPEQLSEAVGAAIVKTAVHTLASVLLVLLAGQEIVGVSSSSTVTVNEQVAVFPVGSLTVYTTVVVPTGYVPEALVVLLKSFVELETEQLSATVGVATVTARSQELLVVDCVLLAGQTTVGFSLSVTVTVNEQVAVLLLLSVAVYVTVVVPSG